jgi:hypothetical protein
VLAYSGGYVLTRRALPAAGAGLVEVALTLALTGMGMQFSRALLGVLVYRLFNFWLPIIPALAYMPAIRDLRASGAQDQSWRRRSWRAAPRKKPAKERCFCSTRSGHPSSD